MAAVSTPSTMGGAVGVALAVVVALVVGVGAVVATVVVVALGVGGGFGFGGASVPHATPTANGESNVISVNKRARIMVRTFLAVLRSRAQLAPIKHGKERGRSLARRSRVVRLQPTRPAASGCAGRPSGARFGRPRSTAEEKGNMKRIIFGLVAIAPLALVACDQNKQSDPPTNNTVTNPAPAANNDKTSTAPATHDDFPDQKKADLDKTTSGVMGEKTNNPTAMGGGPSVEGSREWARDRIAQATCDHYQSCGDIAKGKKYDDMNSCLTQRKADADKDYPAAKCTKIDKDRLSTCIDKLKAQKCGGVLTGTPSECDDGKVCIEK